MIARGVVGESDSGLKGHLSFDAHPRRRRVLFGWQNYAPCRVRGGSKILALTQLRSPFSFQTLCAGQNRQGVLGCKSQTIKD
jgi:hypothetical protein